MAIHTTGGRMDRFTPKLLALGLKGTLGKSARSQVVKDALRQHKVVYCAAIGGAGAVLSGFVKKLEVVAYEDLGTEAIRRLEVAGSRPSWSTTATAVTCTRTA